MQKKLLSLSVGVLIFAFGLNPSAVLAWGPERETFTMESPATYPIFNSITNNPTIGDERDFVRIAEIDSSVTSFKNEVEVEAGKKYEVYIYVHNNASATFNDAAHNNAGVAVETKLASSFSKIVTPEQKGTVTGTVMWKKYDPTKTSGDRIIEANPGTVWDEAYMTATDVVTLRYLPGSAKIYNDWNLNETTLSDRLFAEDGTYLGYKDSLNGVFPGCEEYHGVIMYTLVAEKLDITLNKTVSLNGTDFVESVEAKPGDELTFKIAFENTGNTALENVTVWDTLPDGLSLVSGSIQLFGNESTTGTALSDALITNGLNVGRVGINNRATITYKVKVGSNFNCGSTNLTNIVHLSYDGGPNSSDCECNSTGEKNSNGSNKDGSNCQGGSGNEKCDGDIKDSAIIVVTRTDGCEDCTTNPELPECQTMPNTGPAEAIMAIIVIAGVGGGGYYLYRTRKTLKKVEIMATGKDIDGGDTTDNGTSQKPDNMIK